MHIPTAKERAPLRVLVVDDNRDAADSLATLLHLLGYEARAVYNGIAGLDAANTFRPDCFVLDIGLPGIDGYAVAKRIRADKRWANAKLVALSAYSDEEHKRKVKEAGFDFDLTKPLRPEYLERFKEMLDAMVDLTNETKELIGETRAELRRASEERSEVKEALEQVKEELREVKEEVKEEMREVKEEVKGIQELLNGEKKAAGDAS